MSSLAATLREAELGMRVCLELADGSKVAGVLSEVDDELVSLDGGARQVDLECVKRINLEFSSPSERRLAA